MISHMPDDEWSEAVANGEAFSAEALVVAMPATIPLLQMFNPGGLPVPKRIRLRCVESMAFGGLAINQNIRRHDVALPSTGPPFGGPENLLGGGPASIVEFRFDNPVVASGSPFWLILSTGNTRKDYPVLQLDWGHDLLPTQGLMHSGIPGGFIILGYQWTETNL